MHCLEDTFMHSGWPPHFDALRDAAPFGAADVRGVTTLLGGCERLGAAQLALDVHRWACGEVSSTAASYSSSSFLVE